MNGNKMKQITFSVVTMLILTACGGGGDSSSPNIKDNNEINSNNRDSAERDNNNEENERIKNLVADVKKTGQTTIYSDYDDGYYNKGVEPNYTRENDIVTDHITNLMWQDDVNVITVATNSVKTSSSVEYDNSALGLCKALRLGGYTDWRLPSIYELVMITDKGRTNPAINPIFQNVISNTNANYSGYWSSTKYRYNRTYTWTMNFSLGRTGNSGSYRGHGYNYTRCVRNNK